MSYEQRPNNGSLFESRPGSKTDYNGKIQITEPGNYVMFGRKKTIQTRDGKTYNIVEISMMKERVQSTSSNKALSSNQNYNQPSKNDLPF
jgi:hypothetical protein